MDKKQRHLIVTIVSFIVIIVVAMIAYNRLKGSAEPVSFTPTMASTPWRQKGGRSGAEGDGARSGRRSGRAKRSLTDVIADEVVEEVEADEDDLLGP